MSMETSQWLNTNTLIGMTAERGKAWHYRAEEQGQETNHYTGFVPVADVVRRLFDWDAQNTKLRIQVPADNDNFTTIGDDGTLMREIVDQTRNVTYHPVTGQIFGVYKTDSIHQYSEWLLDNLAHLVTADGLAVTTDSLGIGSAGVLRGGAQAWVQLEPHETFKTPEGVAYRSHITAYSSHDSSMATTYGRGNTVVVCDNTLSLARKDMSRTGQQYKVRRSAKSMSTKLKDARQALNLIIESSDSFAEEIKRLCEMPVTERQWQAFLGEIAPFPEEDGRAKTLAENRREKLTSLYRNDNRVAPWAGTAWGVLQATNTYDHHEASNRSGLTRGERNTTRAIDGDQAKSDEKTLRLLDLVLSNS
ncbi:DUF932 domain-containing protein [Nocardia sp. FBN12]|uniref:DUF932 domain-containing protein n=1 Tax=Nocardia sp. FBN12 TaxID=3419766 RepID=UPI003D08357A